MNATAAAAATTAAEATVDNPYTLYKDVLNIDSDDIIREIIEKISTPYNPSDDAYYLEIMNRLYQASYQAASNGSYTVILKSPAGTSEINRINAKPKHAGTFGSVHKSRVYERAYKRILIKSPLYARNLLIEIFIQCVLSMDDIYGDAVPQPIGLLKESSSPLSVVLIMEYVGEGTINDYLFNTYNHNKRLLTLEDLYPLMKNLVGMLAHFDEVYRFRHNDLHMENVIVTPDAACSMIDFGKSCLTYDGRSYSAFSGIPCTGYDLLFLNAAILCFYYMAFEETTRKFMIGAMNDGILTDEGKRVFNTTRQYIASGRMFESRLLPELEKGDARAAGIVFHMFTIENVKMPIGNPLYVQYPQMEPAAYMVAYEKRMHERQSGALPVARSLAANMNLATGAATVAATGTATVAAPPNNRLSGTKRRHGNNGGNSGNRVAQTKFMRRQNSGIAGGRRRKTRKIR